MKSTKKRLSLIAVAVDDGVGDGDGACVSLSINSSTLHVKLPHRGMFVGAEFCAFSASFITTDIPSSWCTSI